VQRYPADIVDGVETRELRCFVAVAEELHFGRAAERLGIAQPPLSRTITLLERRLGLTLLKRSSRKVTLTAAGAVLLADSRVILGALAVAERRARRAAAGAPNLVLAAKAGAAGELLAKLLDAYAAEPGAVPVELTLGEARQQERQLRDGQVDVALLHLPFDSAAGFDTEQVATEGQVAILPVTHPLAARDQVRTDEVATLPELPLARYPGAEGAYPDGPGTEARSLTQLLQMIALGRATAVLPESVAADLRGDLAAVPVTDAPVVTTVIAWPPLSRSREVADLVRVATRISLH
jgi:DNA-binding transcriptional LysR family regulator